MCLFYTSDCFSMSIDHHIHMRLAFLLQKITTWASYCRSLHGITRQDVVQFEFTLHWPAACEGHSPFNKTLLMRSPWFKLLLKRLDTNFFFPIKVSLWVKSYWNALGLGDCNTLNSSNLQIQLNCMSTLADGTFLTWNCLVLKLLNAYSSIFS